MSLLSYEQQFASLKMNQANGEKSPHKIAMLLAMIDLFETNQITQNFIYFDEMLIAAFNTQFEKLARPSDRCNPCLPYFHLRSSKFWHHYIKPGQLTEYRKLTTVKSQIIINQYIAFVYLEDELFELLNNQAARLLLKNALYENLTEQRRTEVLDIGIGWNWLEVEATVQDYFSMLSKELNGETYNKSEHRRALITKVNRCNSKPRSEGAVEFKHQNISAVLIEMGQPYIAGYKPAFNYQGQLQQVVLAHLAAHQAQLDNLLLTAEVSLKPVDYQRHTINWQQVLDEEAPERIPQIAEAPRQYLARKTNFTQREHNNRKLGEQGEAFVIEFERQRLIHANRPDLAAEVEWSSKEKGDGLGYDVRSFQWQNKQPIEEEHYIEVKTTNSGKYQPFYISANELAYSKEYANRYSLYRVYDFNKQSRLFQLSGAVDQHVYLQAQNYRASLNVPK
jgi:hypothetical protein